MPKTLCYRPFQACPSVSVNKTFNPKHCAQNPFTNASEMHQARVGICLDIGVKQLLMIGEFWIRTVDRAAVALMRRTCIGTGAPRAASDRRASWSTSTADPGAMESQIRGRTMTTLAETASRKTGDAEVTATTAGAMMDGEAMEEGKDTIKETVATVSGRWSRYCRMAARSGRLSRNSWRRVTQASYRAIREAITGLPGQMVEIPPSDGTAIRETVKAPGTMASSTTTEAVARPGTTAATRCCRRINKDWFCASHWVERPSSRQKSCLGRG